MSPDLEQRQVNHPSLPSWPLSHQERNGAPILLREIKGEDPSLRQARELERFLGMQTWQLKVTGENIPRIMKDPCVVVENGIAKLWGTQGDDDVHNLGVLVAEGPSNLLEDFRYLGKAIVDFADDRCRPDFCAPGGIRDEETGRYIYAAQTHCFSEGGAIEVFSVGQGTRPEGRVLPAKSGSSVAVIYDSHLSRWNDETIMTVNMGPQIGTSSVFVATKIGPGWNEWKVAGHPSLTSADDPVQASDDAEWNKEGSCVGQIGKGKIGKDGIAVMLAVGFTKPDEFGGTVRFGTKQRITLHAGQTPQDAFEGLAIPFKDPRLQKDKKVTELGHAAWVTGPDGRVFMRDGKVYFSFQGRDENDLRWGYFIGSVYEDRLMTLAENIARGRASQPQQLERVLLEAA